MRLVLLPAFDGTGAMFGPFVEQLGDAFDALPIAYPEAGPQDYRTLAEHIEQRLAGDGDYIVLGESFAGPLAYRLATGGSSACRGAIFVATYLTNPSPAMLKVLTALPARLASAFVSRPFVIRSLTLSRRADRAVARAIAANFGSVDPHAIRQRLRTINGLGDPPQREVPVPCLYLQATDDKLVPAARLGDFERLCPDLEVHRVEGGHFVVQENPRACARLVLEKFRRTE